MAHISPSTINGTEGIPAILEYVNTVTENWISNMFLIGIYIIFLLGYYRAKGDFIGGFAIAGYSTFIVAMLFWIAGFISGITFGTTIAVAIVGSALVLLSKSGN